MPRITTSDAKDETVNALVHVAKMNRRTPAKEALVAVEGHVVNEILKHANAPSLPVIPKERRRK